MSEDNFEILYEVLGKFEPDALQFIEFWKPSDFAAALDPSLLITEPNKAHPIATYLLIMSEKGVCCPDIWFALAKRALHESGEVDSLHSYMRESIMSQNPSKVSSEAIRTTLNEDKMMYLLLSLSMVTDIAVEKYKISSSIYIKGRDRDDDWPIMRIQFWIMLMRTKVQKKNRCTCLYLSPSFNSVPKPEIWDGQNRKGRKGEIRKRKWKIEPCF